MSFAINAEFTAKCISQVVLRQTSNSPNSAACDRSSAASDKTSCLKSEYASARVCTLYHRLKARIPTEASYRTLCCNLSVSDSSVLGAADASSLGGKASGGSASNALRSYAPAPENAGRSLIARQTNSQSQFVCKWLYYCLFMFETEI